MTRIEAQKAEYKAAAAAAKAAQKAYIAMPLDDLAALREARWILKQAEMKRDRLQGRLLTAIGHV